MKLTNSGTELWPGTCGVQGRRQRGEKGRKQETGPCGSANAFWNGPDISVLSLSDLPFGLLCHPGGVECWRYRSNLIGLGIIIFDVARV